MNELITDGFADVDDDVSPYYEQLLSNVQCIDVCFNIKLKSGGYIGRTYIDVIVDRCVNSEERVVIINQNIDISDGLKMLIGVLAIETKSKKRSFSVNQLEINNHQGRADLFLID